MMRTRLLFQARGKTDDLRITETGCEILTRPPPASSASKKRKKKKSKAAAVGEADVEEDGGSGAATPIGDAAVGVEGLEVTGNGQ